MAGARASPVRDGHPAPGQIPEKLPRWPNGVVRPRRGVDKCQLRSRVVFEKIFVVRTLQQVFKRSYWSRSAGAFLRVRLVWHRRCGRRCAARCRHELDQQRAVVGHPGSRALPITELIATPFKLRILPVAASPTQSSTRFGVPFRNAKCFPSSLHSTPLIFASGGTSILTSEPSAIRFRVKPTAY